jgi:hypothetical protein
MTMHPDTHAPALTIYHRWTGAALYEGQHATMREAVEAAVKAGANLFGANLSDANLSSANLSDANLSYANLSGANLSGANLSYANLSDANLSDANLSYANLSRADLSGANITDKSGQRRILRGFWQAGPLGSEGRTLMIYATDAGLYAKTGCFGPSPIAEFLEAAWNQHGDNKYGRAYRAAVECAKAALGE